MSVLQTKLKQRKEKRCVVYSHSWESSVVSRLSAVLQGGAQTLWASLWPLSEPLCKTAFIHPARDGLGRAAAAVLPG